MTSSLRCILTGLVALHTYSLLTVAAPSPAFSYPDLTVSGGPNLLDNGGSTNLSAQQYVRVFSYIPCNVPLRNCLILYRRFPIPFTDPPITLVLEEGPDLQQSKPETVFQTLVEAVAELSQHDQTQLLPPQEKTTSFHDVAITLSNPAALEEMTYGTAVSSVRGLGEFLWQENKGKKGFFVRVGVHDHIVGTMELKRSTAEQDIGTS